MGQQRVDVGFRTYQASAAIAKNLRVKLNSSNKLAVAGINDLDIGFLETAALAADEYKTVVLHNKPGTQFGVADAAISKGARVYPGASGKVTSINTGRPRWIAATAATTDGDIIELYPYVGDGVSGGITAASSALTGDVIGANTWTAFDKSLVIGADTLKAGDVLRIRAQVIATSTNSTDTLSIRAKVAGIVVVTATALDVANDNIGYIDFEITIRTAGASGTMVGAGIAIMCASDGAPKIKNLASTAIDTTVANTVTIEANWSANSASDSCRLDVLTVHKLNS